MKISIVPNREKDVGLHYTSELLSIIKAFDSDVVLSDEFSSLSALNGRIQFVPEEKVYQNVDFLIVLGGDGTIMRAARRAALKDIPLLGINLGRLGYLAELEKNELNMIESLIRGNYKIEERMMLDVRIEKEDGTVIELPPAFNDAVISTGYLPRIVEISLSCETLPMKKYRADGLIISTPSGSTAYSLAAGGPLIDPSMKAFCITPVSPQSLCDKPIIFPDHLPLVFRVSPSRYADEHVLITIDGTECIELSPTDTVRVTRSPYVTRMVKIKNNNFFNILHNKMSEI